MISTLYSISSGRGIAALASLLVGVVCLSPVNAEVVDFDIESKATGESLLDLAETAEIQIAFAAAETNASESPEISGRYTVPQALDQALDGTGLDYRIADDDFVVVTAAGGLRAPAEQAPAGSDAPAPVLLAQLQTESDRRAVERAAAAAARNGDPVEDRRADEIVVTGTRLQLNAGDLSKQTFVITAADLADMGETTLEGALRRVPQNFGGLSPTNAAVGNSDLPGGERFANGVRDTSGASTINLRGIDSGSRTSGTLVLIDGRRLGQSGAQGGVQDISAIPASRVERIEIVLDGASALYGSDAIGGVVNIIMKKDEHFSMWGNYLDSTENFGDVGEYQLGFNGGFAWDGGDLSFGLSTRQSSEVLARDIGLRFYDSRVFDPVTGERREDYTFRSTAPISSYAGNLLDGSSYLHQTNNNHNPTLADFAPGVSPTGAFQDDEAIVPEIEQYNFDVSVRQSLSDRVEFSAGLIGFTRDSMSKSGAQTASTGGGFSDAPGIGALLESVFEEPGRTIWGLYPAFGIPTEHTKSRSLELFTDLTVDLSDTWDLTLGLSRSDNDHDYVKMDSVRDDADDYTGWNPFGDGLGIANVPFVDDIDGPLGPLQPGEWTDSTGAIYTGTLLDFLQQEGAWSTTDNKQTIASASLRGELFDLPGGTVRMVVGGEYRDNSLDLTAYNPPNGGTDNFLDYNDLIAGSIHSAAFAEFFVPIVGSDNAIPGIQSLSFQGAVRYEDIEHSGDATDLFLDEIEGLRNQYDATTYSVGLVWSPADVLNVKANFNTSFKAPELLDLYDPVFVSVIDDALCARITALRHPGGPVGWCQNPGDVGVHPDQSEWYQPFGYTAVFGGNPDLDPERSDNWSATVEVQPIDSLRLSATWSRREFIDKVISPGAAIRAFGGTAHEQIPQAFEFEPGTDYVRVYRLNKINADSNLVEGLDFVADWSLDTGIGEFNVKAGWSVAQTNTTRIGNADEASNVIGIDYPRESGQLTLGWNLRNWRVTTDTSYRGATVNANWHTGSSFFGTGPGTGTRSESWTQTNVKASYDFADSDGWLSGTTLGIGINNAGKQFQKINYYHNGELVDRVNAHAASTGARPRSIFIELRKEF